MKHAFLIFLIVTIYHALSIVRIAVLAFFGFMLGAILSDETFMYAALSGAIFGGAGIYDYVRRIKKGEPLA